MGWAEFLAHPRFYNMSEQETPVPVEITYATTNAPAFKMRIELQGKDFTVAFTDGLYRTTDEKIVAAIDKAIAESILHQRSLHGMIRKLDKAATEAAFAQQLMARQIESMNVAMQGDGSSSEALSQEHAQAKAMMENAASGMSPEARAQMIAALQDGADVSPATGVTAVATEAVTQTDVEPKKSSPLNLG